MNSYLSLTGLQSQMIWQIGGRNMMSTFPNNSMVIPVSPERFDLWIDDIYQTDSKYGIDLVCSRYFPMGRVNSSIFQFHLDKHIHENYIPGTFLATADNNPGYQQISRFCHHFQVKLLLTCVPKWSMISGIINQEKIQHLMQDDILSPYISIYIGDDSGSVWLSNWW